MWREAFDEVVLAAVRLVGELVLVFGVSALILLGHEPRVDFLEGVADVLEQDQPEHDAQR